MFWFGFSDAALLCCCIVGCLAALLLAAGVFPRISAAVCWVLYLSIVSVGQPFTGFQWDALLLEAGFLALFAGTSWIVWAYRFLLFRLMFESGAVKLLSHDPNWRNLHALRFDFMTQPLPDPIAYYVYRFPARAAGCHDGGNSRHRTGRPVPAVCSKARATDRRRPADVFASPDPLDRQLRLLQSALARAVPMGTRRLHVCSARPFIAQNLAIAANAPTPNDRQKRLFSFLRAVSNIVIALLIAIGAIQLLTMFVPAAETLARKPLSLIAPFEIVNTYGLFAVMTTTRPEIVIEGSNDQTNWIEYSFRYKPGELHRGLPLVAPYQPRLDWQMWFAALGNIQENNWVGNLMYRLLLGEPSVPGLLDPPPLPQTSAVHARSALQIRIHESGRAPSNRRGLAAAAARRLVRSRFAEGPLEAPGLTRAAHTRNFHLGTNKSPRHPDPAFYDALKILRALAQIARYIDASYPLRTRPYRTATRVPDRPRPLSAQAALRRDSFIAPWKKRTRCK